MQPRLYEVRSANPATFVLRTLLLFVVDRDHKFERVQPCRQQGASDLPSSVLFSDFSAGKMPAASWWCIPSLLSLLRTHWDYAPEDRAVASWPAPVLWRFRLARVHRQSARGLAHSKT
jgi:hypothetical protein